jgi:hypothetical protein
LHRQVFDFHLRISSIFERAFSTLTLPSSLAPT